MPTAAGARARIVSGADLHADRSGKRPANRYLFAVPFAFWATPLIAANVLSAASLAASQPFDIAEPYSDSISLADLTVNYKFESFDLTSVTSNWHGNSMIQLTLPSPEYNRVETNQPLTIGVDLSYRFR